MKRGILAAAVLLPALLFAADNKKPAQKDVTERKHCVASSFSRNDTVLDTTTYSTGKKSYELTLTLPDRKMRAYSSNGTHYERVIIHYADGRTENYSRELQKAGPVKPMIQLNDHLFRQIAENALKEKCRTSH
jgi:hypothetical protein